MPSRPKINPEAFAVKIREGKARITPRMLMSGKYDFRVSKADPGLRMLRMKEGEKFVRKKPGTK